MAISADDRRRLILLARSAAEAEAGGRSMSAPSNATGILAERRGCFVTLTNVGRLRGCIGTFQPHGPLGEMIVEMGAAAARDTRFVGNPVTPEELPELTVEVSVLSPLEPTDQPENLQIGAHGIYIVTPRGSGCFLPEVAIDQDWDAEQFLAHCCMGKAGLSPDAWRQPDATVFLFTSEKFDH